jgi:uncharacterized membrane protein
MRGSLSLDLLIGLLVLVLLSGSVLPKVDTFKEAFKVASCSYLKDLYTAESNLASSLSFSYSVNYRASYVAVKDGNITVFGEGCG